MSLSNWMKLWVRETWAKSGIDYFYKADHDGDIKMETIYFLWQRSKSVSLLNKK